MFMVLERRLEVDCKAQGKGESLLNKRPHWRENISDISASRMWGLFACMFACMLSCMFVLLQRCSEAQKEQSIPLKSSAHVRVKMNMGCGGVLLFRRLVRAQNRRGEIS